MPPGIKAQQVGWWRRAAGLLSLAFVVGATTAAAPAPDARENRPVGRSHVAYADDARRSWLNPEQPRPLAATVWYPAAAESAPAAWQVGVFDFGSNARDAMWHAGAQKLPLILLSHGTGGSAAQLSWLAETLAARGFVVAGVDHHGNTAAEGEPMLPGFVLWWERAQDIRVLLDRLLSDERFAPRIDPDRIGIAGFSLGGYTSLLGVGARTDLDASAAYCAVHADDDSCRPPPESVHAPDAFARFAEADPVARASIARAGEDYRDLRIDAAFLIAPALAQALDRDSLRGIDVPVRIVTGGADRLVLPRLLRELAAVVPGATLEVIDDAGHYTFLAPCSPKGREVLPVFCTDPDGIDRRVVHARVAADASDFFSRYLCPQDTAGAPTTSGTGRTQKGIDPCSTR